MKNGRKIVKISQKCQKIAIWRPKRAQIGLKKNFDPIKKKFFWTKKKFFFRFFRWVKIFFSGRFGHFLASKSLFFGIFGYFSSKMVKFHQKYLFWGTIGDKLVKISGNFLTKGKIGVWSQKSPKNGQKWSIFEISTSLNGGGWGVPQGRRHRKLAKIDFSRPKLPETPFVGHLGHLVFWSVKNF